jgi:hypothetical protein
MHAVALADARQAGVVGQQLVEAVPQLPADAQPVGRDGQESSLGADPLAEQDELELEEDHRVVARSPPAA